MIASEDVQYFRFDSDGNMFMYEHGAGFSGDCHLVSPGDELMFNQSKGTEGSNNSDVFSEVQSVVSTDVVCDGSSTASKEECSEVIAR